MDNDEMDFHVVAGRGYLFWCILVFGSMLAMTTLTYCMRPHWIGMEREADVASHQYVEARKTEVLTNIQAYDELGTRIVQNEGNDRVTDALKMQQGSLKKKIKNALAKIPKDTWPEGSERFK